MIGYRIASLLIGYGCGLVFCGYILGRIKHVNIREEGSGNIGTTNTLRLLGVGPGGITLLLDCLKAVFAALIVQLIFSAAGVGPETLKILRMYAAFGAVMGHMFPVYFRFRGGKGIATGMGFLIVAEPRILVIALALFLIAVILTRYVSLGSILAAISLPVQAVIYYAFGLFRYGTPGNLEALILISIVGILAVVLHHANIGRLLHGTERKFSFHPKRTTEKEKENG